MVDDELSEEAAAPPGARRTPVSSSSSRWAPSRSPHPARRDHRPGPTSPGRCGGARRAPAAGSDPRGRRGSRRRSDAARPAARTGAPRSTRASTGATSAVDGTRSTSGSRSGSTKTICRPSRHSTSRSLSVVRATKAWKSKVPRSAVTSSKRPRSVSSSGATTTPGLLGQLTAAPTAAARPSSRPPPGKHHMSGQTGACSSRSCISTRPRGSTRVTWTKSVRTAVACHSSTRSSVRAVAWCSGRSPTAVRVDEDHLSALTADDVVVGDREAHREQLELVVSATGLAPEAPHTQ